jgi:copper chaperone NosL
VRLVAISGTALLLACGAAAPVALRWDEEACKHCHMTLSDRRYGAEVVTVHGRTLAFDDAGCAAEYLAGGALPAEDVSSIWVIDYSRPDTLVDARLAFFVRSDSFATPMGSGIIATASAGKAAELAGANGGTRLSWPEVVEYVATHRHSAR